MNSCELSGTVTVVATSVVVVVLVVVEEVVVGGSVGGGVLVVAVVVETCSVVEVVDVDAVDEDRPAAALQHVRSAAVRRRGMRTA